MASGKVILDTYSDLIIMIADPQKTNTAVRYLSTMISDPECVIHKGKYATKIHNLKLYIDGTLRKEYDTKPLFKLNNEQLKDLDEQIESRIKHDAQFKQIKGYAPKATRSNWEDTEMQELLLGDRYKSITDAKKLLIRAINDIRVLVVKDETGKRPAFNIGALHLCADGELFNIEDIITMYKFTDQDMKDIITAIEQRIVRDAELVAMAKRMKETKVQSTQAATAPMTIFQKAQNWLAGLKQQFKTK